MLRSNKHLCVLAALLCQLTLGAWAQPTQVSANEQPSSKVEIYGEAFTDTKLLSASQRRLVFYRPVEQAEAVKGVLSLFVDQQYHVSLLPGSFSKLCAEQTPYTLSAIRRETGAKDRRGPSARQQMQAQLLPAQTKYFKASVLPTGELQLSEMDAVQAIEQLRQTREAIHTVSRVAAGRTCEEETLRTESPNEKPAAQMVRPLPAVPAKLTQKSITEPEPAITELGEIGPSEPISKPEPTMRLSQHKAEHVKKYF